MQTKWIIFGAALLAACAVGAWLALTRPEQAPLPPRHEHATLAQARAAAGDWAIPLAGTGSMAPWIPPRAAGRTDPVGYAVVEAAPFSGLRAGDVVLYHDRSRDLVVIHRLVRRWGAGWLATGDANRRADYHVEITPENYDSRVIAIHVLAPAPLP